MDWKQIIHGQCNVGANSYFLPQFRFTEPKKTKQTCSQQAYAMVFCNILYRQPTFLEGTRLKVFLIGIPGERRVHDAPNDIENNSIPTSPLF